MIPTLSSRRVVVQGIGHNHYEWNVNVKLSDSI